MSADTQGVYPPTHLGGNPADAERKNGQSVGRVPQLLLLEVRRELVLAAVLFTDIVASTEQQARVGAREWSRLMDHHDAMVRDALARHRGHEVQSTEHGFLVTFASTGSALRCAAEVLKEG